MLHRGFFKFLASPFALAVLVLLLCGSRSAQAAPLVLKFAGQNPPDHFATVSMRDIAKEVEKNTNGRIQIKVFPANQLGDYSLVYEELIRGTIEMAAISFPSQFDSRMDLIYVHGYTSSYAQVAKVYDPNGWFFKKMDEFNKALGVKLLGMYLEGMVGMGTVKEMRDPLNPKVDHGVLLRIPNMDVFKTALEGSKYRTISIPFADVYQSMQTGVCDGDTGYSIVAAYTALGDVIKHWYNLNKNTECLGIMISAKVWDKLSNDDKKVLQAAVNKQTALSIKNAEANDKKFLELMRKKGIKVHTYTTEQLRPLMDAFAATWGQLDQSKGKELMDEFRKEMKRISDSTK
ncbi:TRAP transporter substrate-binding protein DctP [Cloacibacillus evryensis]|uniref:TRAP transporter substrate-binding protein DctP n=1 Tax=Cloacibacillus evryensis TaxID=508460 RepID=UPI003AB6486D